MVIQDDLIGGFRHIRQEVNRFSDSEITLLEAFSTHAAIAVSNDA